MFADGVMESSVTTGLGDYQLNGSVYNGLAFGQKFEDGEAVVFIAQTLNRSKFEIVLGSYSVGPPKELIRTTILSSSAAGAKINWLEDDVYYIASIASADALAGLVKGNHATARPWWVQFGRWLKKNFPSAGLSTDYFYDGSTDIKLGQVDVASHSYHSMYMPAGALLEWAGSAASVPDYFLLCDGASYLRADYPELFAAIGTTYGAADSTHFNVPNKKGRFTVGVDSDSSGPLTTFDIDTVGTIGGDESVDIEITVEGTTIASVTGSPSAIEIRAGGNQNVPSPVHTHVIPALDLDLDVTAPSSIKTVPPFIAMNYIISTGGV